MSRSNNGHPYGRLSSDPQLEGDGQRRQKAADFQGFCTLHGFKLSKKVWFDEGVSAYDESNWDHDAALGRFVAKARRGIEVRKGDCLIVEDWDRLARLPWTRLVVRVAELFEAGIHLGDATRMRLIRCDSEDPGDAVDLIFGTSRGHGESKRKSFLVQSAKDERRRNASAGEMILTRALPAWIHIVPCADDDPDGRWYGSTKTKKMQWGKLALREPQASIMREIITLKLQGLGPHRIVREMIDRGVLLNPSGNPWRADKIVPILTDRRLIGELPPARFKSSRKRKGNGKLDHPAIPGYYPALLNEAEFFRLKASIRRGPNRRGRETELPNPFKGLIRDALSGESYYLLPIKQTDGTRRPKLVNSDGTNARGTLRSFDHPSFEEAIFSELKEIDPADIIGEGDSNRDAATLAGQLEDCKQRRDAFKALTRGKKMTPLLVEEAIALDNELEELQERLAEAQERAAQPLSQAWGEQKTLISTLLRDAADPIGIRLRLRERLRETVKRIWLLVVPRNRGRIAMVQMDFEGYEPPRRRTYFLYHKQAVRTQHCYVPASCVRLSEAWTADAREANLSSVEDAKDWAEVLSKVKLD